MSVAALPSGQRPGWPKGPDLEKWMFAACMESDSASVALRKIVHVNPGFGAFLTSDDDIVDLVMNYAKRLKKPFAVLEEGADVNPEVLYRPLCEMIWKVFGLILSSLQQADNVACGATVAISKDVKGQLRMLLQTNEELSRQLHEMRRAYLRELSEHRHRERRFPSHTQAKLDSLIEEPIMFYEPLQTLLDETTKQFVRDTVEERLKLELRANLAQKPQEEEEEERSPSTQHLVSKDALLKTERELFIAEGELKKVRLAHMKEADLHKKAEESATRWKAEAEEAKRINQELTEALANYDAELAVAKAKMQETRPPPEPASPVPNREGEIDDLKVALKDSHSLVAQLQTQLHDLKLERDKHPPQTPVKVPAKGKEREPEPAKEKKPAKPEPEVSPAKEKKKPEKDEGAKPERVEVIVERVVHVPNPADAEMQKELSEARLELERHLTIESELREANRQLEKALAATEAENKRSNSEVDATPKQKKKNRSKDIEDAVANITKTKELELRAQREEIERLKAELNVALQQPKEPRAKKPEKPEKEKPEPPDDGPDKRRISELEKKNAELEREIAMLEFKLEELKKMMKSKFKDEEVEDALRDIEKRAPAERPSTRKRHRETVYDRLYNDAKRRKLTLQEYRRKLDEEHQAIFKSAMTKIKTLSELHRLSALASLERSAKATNERFENALESFLDGGDAAEAFTSEDSPSAQLIDNSDIIAMIVKMSRRRCHKCGATMIPASERDALQKEVTELATQSGLPKPSADNGGLMENEIAFQVGQGQPKPFPESGAYVEYQSAAQAGRHSGVHVDYMSGQPTLTKASMRLSVVDLGMGQNNNGGQRAGLLPESSQGGMSVAARRQSVATGLQPASALGQRPMFNVESSQVGVSVASQSLSIGRQQQERDERPAAIRDDRLQLEKDRRVMVAASAAVVSPSGSPMPLASPLDDRGRSPLVLTGSAQNMQSLARRASNEQLGGCLGPRSSVEQMKSQKQVHMSANPVELPIQRLQSAPCGRPPPDQVLASPSQWQQHSPSDQASLGAGQLETQTSPSSSDGQSSKQKVHITPSHADLQSTRPKPQLPVERRLQSTTQQVHITPSHADLQSTRPKPQLPVERRLQSTTQQVMHLDLSSTVLFEDAVMVRSLLSTRSSSPVRNYAELPTIRSPRSQSPWGDCGERGASPVLEKGNERRPSMQKTDGATAASLLLQLPDQLCALKVMVPSNSSLPKRRQVPGAQKSTTHLVMEVGSVPAPPHLVATPPQPVGGLARASDMSSTLKQSRTNFRPVSGSTVHGQCARVASDTNSGTRSLPELMTKSLNPPPPAATPGSAKAGSGRPAQVKRPILPDAEDFKYEPPFFTFVKGQDASVSRCAAT